MKATTLCDFFLGKTSALNLAAEASVALENVGPMTRRVHFQDLDDEQEFTITRQMLVRLCDAVVAGKLPAQALEPIGFSVIASDYLQ